MKTLLILALTTVSCCGMSFNPKGTMCIGDGFSTEQAQEIITAAEEWRDRTSGEVDFDIRRGNGCDVDVIAEAHLRYDDDGIALGITDPFGHWIKFNVQDTYHGHDILDYSLRETALHEIGHYLTGGQHSATRGNIMFAKGGLHRNEKGEVAADRHLTDEDVSRWTGKSNHSYYAESDRHPAELPDELDF